MNPQIHNIIEQYKSMNDGDKNRLLYELDILGFREIYDIKLKSFNVQYVNIYGKLLADRTFKAMSKRQLERELNYFELNRKIFPYDKNWDHSRYNEQERIIYRNNAYVDCIITEL